MDPRVTQDTLPITVGRPECLVDRSCEYLHIATVVDIFCLTSWRSSDTLRGTNLPIGDTEALFSVFYAFSSRFIAGNSPVHPLINTKFTTTTQLTKLQTFS